MMAKIEALDEAALNESTHQDLLFLQIHLIFFGTSSVKSAISASFFLFSD